MIRRPLTHLCLGLALLTLYGCPVNWVDTYDITDDDPYDLYALYELLEARPEGITPMNDTLDLAQLDTAGRSNYVFIGHQPFYREAAVTGLLAYVERGNRAIISAKEIPEDLGYHLFGDECYYENFADTYGTYLDRFPTTYVDSVTLYRYPTADSFTLVHLYNWHPTTTALSVITDPLLCDPELGIDVLGSLDTLGINFVRVPWGEGEFYLHTNPLFLTNLYVVDSLDYRYPSDVMATALGPGPVYWDEYHRLYRYDRRPGATGGVPRQYEGGRNLLTGNRTLVYIQERPPLAMAWYLLVAGVLLFVIMRGRRRQRIIPVVPPRENASRRFIDTISRLLLERGNHLALARRELAALRFHLNHRFQLGWKEGAPLPSDLAARTGVSEEVARRAATQVRVVTTNKNMQEGDLLRFYRAIEPLYQA